MLEPPDPEILQSRIDAIIHFDRRARLGEIKAPTLVVVAQDDMIAPPYLSEELATEISGAELTVLQYGGHYARG
jgi:aminoacrylate hydrolase